MSDDPISAKRIKKSEFAGVGCLIQGLGLLAPLLLPAILGIPGLLIGLLLMVVLFLVGSAKASKWLCGNCRNPLPSKEVTICSACRAHLE